MDEPQQPPLDEYHGQGGSYVMQGGVRRLVERTREAPPTGAPDEAQAAQRPPLSGRPALARSASTRKAPPSTEPS